MSESKTTLAEQLRRLRRERGHATARDFARTLGISENRYSRYERGEAVPKLDLIHAICAVLGITPNELYGWPAGDAAGGHATAPASTTQAGFAEAAGATGSPSPGARAAAGPGPALHASPADLAAWRLASLLARARTIAGDAAQQPGGLAGMRLVAEIFTDLRREPLATLASQLQAPHAANLPAALDAAIAAEVETLLGLLDDENGH